MKYLSFLVFLIVVNISYASAATDGNAQVSSQQMKIPTRIRKVERSFVIKAPASQMHDIWSTQLSLVSTICPDLIGSVDLLQGRWGNESSIIAWKYNYRGKPAVAKEMIEVIDREKNRIVYRSTEGGPLEEYKSFTWIYETSPDGNVVRWTLEYERDNEDVPEPTAYLDLLMSMMKHIDDHLSTGE